MRTAPDRYTTPPAHASACMGATERKLNEFVSGEASFNPAVTCTGGLDALSQIDYPLLCSTEEQQAAARGERGGGGARSARIGAR